MNEHSLTRTERLSLIRIFRGYGAPYVAIAKAIGVSRQRVHQICKIYGIKKGEKKLWRTLTSTK